jgi:beta-glucosidase-like glycosyl hydrolase
MGAISNNYSFDEAVELAINAGNDILLFTTNKLSGKSLVDSVVGIVMNKISQGKISEQRINESFNRIMQKKQELTSVYQNNADFIPANFELLNYPNPFNAQTTVVVKVPIEGNLSIKVFNVTGEEVAELFNDFKTAGTYTFNFNADKLASGIYFIRMKMMNKILTHKIVLLK